MTTEKPNAKMPYTAPRLVVYGSLQQLTQSVGMGNFMDGGNPGQDLKST